ncbi:aldo/keto reductase [Paraburkholderia strydomiana]
MIHLDDISRIGFGTYRMSIHSRQHHAALLHALRSGCTLVDTASTYTNGESEQLIGKVVRENPDLDFFLITKAGYPASDDQKHSIDPDFLLARLTESISRISKPQIDGFLLHNPERCFDDEAPEFEGDAFDTVMRRSFTFLEEMVSRGVIRYWGLSSNVFHVGGCASSSARLQRLLAIAEEVSATHHFRLIQFPLNLLEDEAARSACNESFLSLARRSGLVTISNRPLNAKGPLGQVRLATYEAECCRGTETDAEETLQRFLAVVRQRLDALGATESPLDFTVVQFLRDTWITLNDRDLVHAVFRKHLAPFIGCLYPEGLPVADLTFFRNFEAEAVVQAKRNMTSAARRLRTRLESDGVIAANDPRSLAEVSINYCLEAGVQHVLVGMRDAKYVDELRRYF